jgi:hypothetical protein
MLELEIDIIEVFSFTLVWGGVAVFVAYHWLKERTNRAVKRALEQEQARRREMAAYEAKVRAERDAQ